MNMNKLIKKLNKNWQDKVIAIGSTTFAVSLLPTILNPTSIVPLETSLPTAIVLGIFAYTCGTLNMKLAVWTQSVSAGMWGLIALMRHG